VSWMSIIASSRPKRPCTPPNKPLQQSAARYRDRTRPLLEPVVDYHGSFVATGRFSVC
jgi:hypothetical protein